MSFGQIIILFRIRERTGLLRVFNGRKATLPTFLWAGGIFRYFYFSPSIGHSAVYPLYILEILSCYAVWFMNICASVLSVLRYARQM